jgi:hypothetical protein
MRKVVAEHSIDLEHRIQFHNTSILATKTRHMNHIVREATELYPNNMNKCWFFCQEVMEAAPSRNLLNMTPDLQG